MPTPMTVWYPSDLGVRLSSSGTQNSMRYAFFPSTRRLAINDGKQTTVYDTGDHQVSGVSQQQGSRQDLAFSSQHGPIEFSSNCGNWVTLIPLGIDALSPQR